LHANEQGSAGTAPLFPIVIKGRHPHRPAADGTASAALSRFGLTESGSIYEDHTKLKFLTIEGDAISQIQVCEECNGYIKLIDTRQYIEKPSASLLDLNTIHLDFVAQEHGYSAVGTKTGSGS
jgi:hypothetical protein